MRLSGVDRRSAPSSAGVCRYVPVGPPAVRAAAQTMKDIIELIERCVVQNQASLAAAEADFNREAERVAEVPLQGEGIRVLHPRMVRAATERIELTSCSVWRTLSPRSITRRARPSGSSVASSARA